MNLPGQRSLSERANKRVSPGTDFMTLSTLDRAFRVVVALPLHRNAFLECNLRLGG